MSYYINLERCLLFDPEVPSAINISISAKS